MKSGIFMCVAILFAVVYASPIALDESTKKQSDKSDSIPLKVVDVPAGVFDIPASESVDKKVEDKIQPDAETPVDVKQIEILDDLNKPQKEGEDVAEEGPNVFGIRFPSILIIRRPAVFQDPFAGFQSPFFSGRPNRPSIFSSFGSSFDDEQQNKEKVDEKEALPSSIDQQEDEQQRNETVIANNVIQRMHQQIGNLFANLFNPDTFFMPRPNYQRPTFPRPTFSRPSLFSPFSGFDETEDDEKLDFDKLPANYSNSTSETKIVDGQLVTVNKTVHRISGNNSNGFFHFSVIKVRPNEPAAVAEELPTAVPSDTPLKISEGETKPVEFAEPDPKMNEVDRPEDEQEKLHEVELESNKYEVQNENRNPSDSQQSPQTDEEIKIIPIKSQKLIKVGSGGVADLSSDIRVNNMMGNEQQGRLRALFDPEEVEIFDV